MSCAAPQIEVGGVMLSTSDFQNAQEILSTVSNASGDPTLDEYEENAANGNNTAGKTGVLLPNTAEGTIPKQTTPPPEIPQKAEQTNDKAPPGGNGTPVPGSPWDGENYDILLSPNFKLRQFTVNAVFPYPLTHYPVPPGYPPEPVEPPAGTIISRQARFNNLKNLASNIAEPLFAKFGPLRITSGIRNKTSGTSGLSQHITGEAADFQFSNWTYARYWEAAQWIKDNIQYDQFIFEHSSNTGLAWFHLSYKSTGNRPVSVRTKVMTMYRNNYSSGLRRYG